MAPELRFWSFDCTSCPSCLVPSICLGGRALYLELLPCLRKTHIRQCISLTRLMHWGDVRSLSKQLQTEHWIPLFIIGFVFHVIGFFPLAALPLLVLMFTPFPYPPPTAHLSVPSFTSPFLSRGKNKFLLSHGFLLCSLGSCLYPCPQSFTFYPKDLSFCQQSHFSF